LPIIKTVLVSAFGIKTLYGSMAFWGMAVAGTTVLCNIAVNFWKSESRLDVGMAMTDGDLVASFSIGYERVSNSFGYPYNA